jgi:hypothetical protein
VARRYIVDPGNCLSIVVSEITMATIFFADPTNGHLTSFENTDWSFGQVFAVVMLFFVVWDIATYPFEPSDAIEGNVTKLRYWWNGIKVRNPRVAKLFRGSSANTKSSRPEELQQLDSGRFSGADHLSKDIKLESDATEIPDVENQLLVTTD